MKNRQWFYDLFNQLGYNPYKYQEDIVFEKIDAKFKNGNRCVIGASPNSGKTMISISFFFKYLLENKGHRILVLAHGTKILKDQFYKEIKSLKLPFTVDVIEKLEDAEKSNANIIIAIPQTVKKLKTKIDLLCVDEAHQFYFVKNKKGVGMIDSIISNCKVKYQLLLTGTPSKFIEKKIPIIPITVNQLYDLGQCCDLVMELATSNININSSTFDDELEVNNRKIKETKGEVFASLDDVLKQIECRLKSINKNNPAVYSKIKTIVDWDMAISQIDKTMIACRNVKQARLVQKYFNSKNIKCAISVHDEGDNSSEIIRFKEEKECKILIVVRRGVLGFNMETLENVIDLTFSLNPDRVLQLLCRVIRKHPQGKEKLFIKVCPSAHVEWYKKVMKCIVCLFEEYYYLQYNGKNFLDIQFPDKIKTPGEGGGGEGGTEPKTKDIDFTGLPLIKFFKDLHHKDNSILNGVEYNTLRNIRAIHFDVVVIRSWDYMFDVLREFMNKFNRLPKAHEEYRDINIGHFYGTNVTKFRNGELDPDKIKQLESLPGWTWDKLDDVWLERFYKIKEFVLEYGKYPGIDNPKDREWVGRQRALWRKGKLDQKYINLLETLPGWNWDIYEARWWDSFYVYKKYTDEKKEIPLIKTFIDDIDIGYWALYQVNNKHKLDNKKILALESTFGWTWIRAKKDKWFMYYEALLDFVLKNGRLPKNKEKHNGINVGIFMHTQRSAYKGKKKSDLDDERIALLEAIPGWEWESERTKKMKKNGTFKHKSETF